MFPNSVVLQEEVDTVITEVRIIRIAHYDVIVNHYVISGHIMFGTVCAREVIPILIGGTVDSLISDDQFESPITRAASDHRVCS